MAIIIAVTLMWPYLWSDTGVTKEDSATLIAPRAHQTRAKSAEIKKARPLLGQKAQEDEFNPFEDEAFKAQLQQVADLYAETAKYPHTSQPIVNPEDVREHEAFEETKSDLPFGGDKDDESPLRLIAATDRYQYFQGDVIQARLQIVNGPSDTFNAVKGVLSGARGDLPQAIEFGATDKSLTAFTASFDSKLVPPNLMSNEMLLKLSVEVGGQQFFTTVGFRYAVAAADVVGIPYVRVEGPNLLIPLQYNVFQAGYYFVNAVLDDEASGRPLIQLQGEGRMGQGNGVITLKAHIAALKSVGSEGSYVLRSIRSYRGAEVGESVDVPASTSQRRFAVQGFPFTDYEDQPHEDEDAQAREDFIRGLGGDDNNE